MKLKWYEKLIVYVLLIIFAIWAFFPFYWAFVNSVKTPSQIFQKAWIPILQFKPTLHNWKVELTTPSVLKALKNSTIVALISTVIAVFLGTLVGFALTAFEYKGFFKNTDIYIFFLTQRILPPAVVLIPIYMCPACGGEVLYDAQFDEWRCKECHRVWGKGVKKPVFELG